MARFKGKLKNKRGQVFDADLRLLPADETEPEPEPPEPEPEPPDSYTMHYRRFTMTGV